MKEVVESFKVDHTKLEAGVYLRKEVKVFGIYPIRVWDIRIIAPSEKKKVPAAAAHVIEHMFAHWLRYYLQAKKVLSVNMMGCGTGMYVETMGRVSKEQLVSALLKVISNFPLESVSCVPGMNPVQCGNPTFYKIEAANQTAETLRLVLEKCIS